MLVTSTANMSTGVTTNHLLTVGETGLLGNIHPTLDCCMNDPKETPSLFSGSVALLDQCECHHQYVNSSFYSVSYCDMFSKLVEDQEQRKYTHIQNQF